MELRAVGPQVAEGEPALGGVLGGLIYRWLSDEPAGTVEGKA